MNSNSLTQLFESVYIKLTYFVNRLSEHGTVDGCDVIFPFCVYINIIGVFINQNYLKLTCFALLIQSSNQIKCNDFVFKMW